MIYFAAFTAAGAALAKKLSDGIHEQSKAFAFEKYAADANLLPIKRLQDWCETAWQEADSIVFIGAAGIAVRGIAPFVKSKLTDPGVAVMDEAGRFVISLLSGHIGGGNDLALKLAELTGGTPVITTATDVNKTFAVDVFAKDNGLHITSMKQAKEVSAAVLRGEKIGFLTDYPVAGEMPACLVREPAPLLFEVRHRREKQDSLLLVPKNICLGIGCKRGTQEQTIRQVVLRFLQEHEIPVEAVCRLASITLKRDEQGLLSFAESLNLPIDFYSPQELNAAPGEFSRSAFVASTTGVDCVCERSAVCGSDAGRLLVRKYAATGVTVAAAEKSLHLKFRKDA